jgi:hypothetical protein
MINFIQHHFFWSGVVAFWIFSAFIDGMPPVCATDGKGYRWLYSSLHSLAGNIFTAFAGKVPGVKQ